ncbi:MAG TPA: tetratricopeptide repeat protein [Flavobacteriales bacterium]|nr:tetratricopeptide repeat protein [Flavobacteriales bacterium]HIN40165.1 tetratricopeptide repeat protein [Flavobacteriales bacterium]
MANYYYAKFQDVITPCNEALEILKDSIFKDLIGLGHFILGAANRSLGELDTAVKYLIKGTENISLRGKLGIYNCYCYYQLAEINVQIKDFLTAEKYYNKVIDIARELGSSSVLFRAYNGIANLNLSINNIDKCKEFLDLSLAVKGLSNAEKGRGYCDLGIYYHENGEYKKAIDILSKSYDIRIKSKLHDAASTSLLNLGKTQLAYNDSNNALKALEQALQICLEYQSKSKLLLCYELIAETYDRLGE